MFCGMWRYGRVGGHWYLNGTAVKISGPMHPAMLHLLPETTVASNTAIRTSNLASKDIQCIQKVAVHLGVWVAISRRHTVGP
jgi:hypothetical protein